ncbi:MAG: hypothetical protein OEY14_06195 [Myxococcales bacterium]|nr:hypothetical protein [Myxococcales bacterium]
MGISVAGELGAEAIDRFAASLIGEIPPATRRLSHVAALWDPLDGSLRNLRIGASSPRSEHDAFLLSFSRARAEAIVITGAILRAEPELRYEPGGLGGAFPGLARWRRERAGLEEPPLLAVLTRDESLDLEHPALHGWARPLIFSTPGVASSLRRRAGAGVEIVGSRRAGLPTLLERLAERGLGLVSLEAGPRTTSALYEPPPQIEELLLSIFHSRELPEPARGEPFLSLEELEGRLPPARAPTWVQEPSGRWSFRRLCRL